MTQPTIMLRSLLLSLALLGAGDLLAQGTGVSVQGIAYDSVRREVLPGAFVTLGGTWSAVSDRLGRFQFDSVRPGSHVMQMQHTRLDSMGLPGVSKRVTLTDGPNAVTIAVPSFPTLWRAACGDRAAPRDSAFVYGTVRDARDGRALGDVLVELVWFDLSVLRNIEMKQRLLRASTRTDANGEYSICGVPKDQGMRIVAAGDSLMSGLIDLMPTLLPVLRQDLGVTSPDRSDTTQLGHVAGTVLGEDGKPVDGVRVVMDDVPQVTTGADGRFVLRGVLAGTRQLELIAIGRTPKAVTVEIAAQQTTTISAVMERVSTLDVVRVVGSNFQRRLFEEFEEHKRIGGSSFLDSTDVAGRGTIESVMYGLPGVWIARGSFGAFTVHLPSSRGGQCQATIWLDGIRSDTELLKSLRPEDIAVVEVFQREFQVPMRYTTMQSRCGAVVVWTKRAVG